MKILRRMLFFDEFLLNFQYTFSNIFSTLLPEHDPKDLCKFYRNDAFLSFAG